MAKQQTTSINKKAEMIYCERCGEDYSATYRRCPFCDERPGRRIDDRGTRGPLQVAVLVVTLIIILAAAFIVFSKVAPLLTGREPEVEQPGVEQPSDPSTEPGTQIPEVEVPVEPEIPDVTTPPLCLHRLLSSAAPISPSSTARPIRWPLLWRPPTPPIPWCGPVTAPMCWKFPPRVL